MRMLLLSGLVVLLAGCAGMGRNSPDPTPYQAGSRGDGARFGYGYVDACAEALQQPANAACELAFQANAATDDDTLFHYLIFRAAEAGRDAGYPYFKFDAPEFSWLTHRGRTHGRLGVMQVRYLRDGRGQGQRRDWSGTVYDVEAIYRGMRGNPAQPMPPSGIAELR